MFRKSMALSVSVAFVAALLAGCSSDGQTDEAGPSSGADTTTTSAVDGGTAELQAIVEALASDEMNGRDNDTPDSVAAQDYIIEQLQQFADPLAEGAGGPDAYRQAIAGGTNILAVIPGGELADEYVIVGAHYDHLGNDCDGITATDDICNGATDNAAGVAAALDIGRSIATGDEPPRRTVILAFWDREEDDLNGSADYVADPAVPLEDTVGYVNFDIQGANLSPALANSTIMVGAETGGPNLVASAQAAATASTLDTVGLSLLFGQGRSDHANFAAAGVPTVFFTDANPPCYHTVGDDLSIVDYDKLGQQIVTAEALTRDLITTDDVPVFDAAAPPASYDDAVSMLDVVSRAEPDFDRFSAEDEALAVQFLSDISAVVDAGPDQFDDAAISTLLGGSVDLVTALATGECDGFLD